MSLTSHELDRLRILERLDEHRLRQVDAARLLGLTERQVRRLVAAYRSAGPIAVASKRRGRPSNRAYPEAIRVKALALVRECYPDFGATLAAEKLALEHQLEIDHETLRRWLIADGQRSSDGRRAPRVHQPRLRRDCFGELIQIDGSHHAWLEERGPRGALLVAIDDATSALVGLRLETSESRDGYFRLVRSYFNERGRPLAFYSDANSIFRTAMEKASGDPTQFGRAMQELEIGLLCATTPQAKGRVERVNATLQDRLVKELRLRGISTFDEANAYLDEYRREHNERFSVAPRNDTDVHRPLDGFNLDRILCVRERRTISNARTISYDNRLLLIDPAAALRGRKIDVRDRGNGDLVLEQFGRLLNFREIDIDQIPPRPPLIDHKDPIRRAPHRPAPNHPWKQAALYRANRPDISNESRPDISYES